MTLQRRLLLLLLIAVPVIWALAVSAALVRARQEINELFDSQQIRLAQQVLWIVSNSGRPAAPPPADGLPAPPPPPPGVSGAEELKDFAVAAWSADGERLLADGDGLQLPFRPDANGFLPVTVAGEPWIVFYLHPAGARWVVAVGQAADERDEVLQGLLVGQFLPWLLMLPVLLLALTVVVRHALRPVRRLAEDIGARGADDLHPVELARLPAELAPLVRAMNRLFERIRRALEHERRLTADAAHELRTPLAALRAQWEAMRVAGDEVTRRTASGHLGEGIDRLGHVLAQLLALSGLDSRAPAPFTTAVDWRQVMQDALSDCLPVLESKGSDVAVEWPAGDAAPLPLTGDNALLTLLLRNLVDNAVRYSPAGSEVQVRFFTDAFTVEDNGPGVTPEVLARLGDRFFRPAGQDAAGSGLGISIVRRVADLHGLTVRFANRPPPATGLRVEVTRRRD